LLSLQKTFVAAALLSLQKTFVAAALLSLQKTFVTAALLSLQKTFAADASLSRRAKLPGVAHSPLQSTYLHSIRFTKSHPRLLVMNHNVKLPPKYPLLNHFPYI